MIRIIVLDIRGMYAHICDEAYCSNADITYYIEMYRGDDYIILKLT